MKRKIYFVLFGFLVIFGNVFALNFSIDFTPPKFVYAGSTNYGILKITNNDNIDGNFYISVIGSESRWVVVQDSVLHILPGSIGLTKIYFSPDDSAIEAGYKYTIKVRSGSDEKTKDFILYVRQKERITIGEIETSSSVYRPGDHIKVFIDISNNDYKDREFEVKISFAGKTQKIDTVVKAKSKKTVQTSFVVDKYQRPGNYKITAEVSSVYGTVEKSKDIKILGVENIRVEKKEENKLFVEYYNIYIKNEGNIDSSYYIKVKKPKSPLVLYSGPETIKDKERYVWKVEIKPGETKVIKYKIYRIDYILLLLLILAILYGVRYVYLFNFSIKKNVVYRKPVKEGSEISVYIELKNRKYPAKKVTVKDVIPPNFELVNTFETIKPVRKETEEGIVLRWKLRSLKPFEERVLHYKIRSKIGVMGTIKLPKAEVEFEVKEKVHKKKSNSPKVKGLEE